MAWDGPEFKEIRCGTPYLTKPDGIEVEWDPRRNSWIDYAGSKWIASCKAGDLPHGQWWDHARYSGFTVQFEQWPLADHDQAVMIVLETGARSGNRVYSWDEWARMVEQGWDVPDAKDGVAFKVVKLENLALHECPAPAF